jgi:hypothetical protein
VSLALYYYRSTLVVLERVRRRVKKEIGKTTQPSASRISLISVSAKVP